MEGISEEAISTAAHLGLNKLIVFWDNNNITIDGSVSAANSTDQIKRDVYKRQVVGRRGHQTKTN